MHILSDKEKAELEEIYASFLNDERVLKMRSIPMHRGSNVYLHSFKVTKEAMRMALRHNKTLDYKSLLVASILHDYYLYDWREDHSLLKGHSKNHPKIAVDNAKKVFDIDEIVASIMVSHMWPINIKFAPKSLEALTLNQADKKIALIEALTSKAYKAKNEVKYYERIAKLFD